MSGDVTQADFNQRAEAFGEMIGVSDAIDSIQSVLNGDLSGAAMSAVAVICKGCKVATQAFKLQGKVRKGQAPKGIKRFDSSDKSVPNSKDHVNFDDGTSMNVDGTVHDKKGGIPKPTNKQKKFLDKEIWPTEIKKN